MKRFLLFAVAATLFAACSNDVINELDYLQNVDDNTLETLVVGFEDDETRIQLNEAQKTVWTNGDLVSVFYRSDANQKWQYSGETGERIAELTRVDEGLATEAMKRVVVVYPYSENYYINTETYNVQAKLPAVQTYLKDSYGIDGNIMISQSEYNDFSLKSVCGWIKLQLTGNGEKIRSITLKGNNGEQVAGELYINSADATSTLSSDSGDADDGDTGSAGGGLVFEDTILKEVSLDCGDGVTLGVEATAFYIALPPQTFTKGITVDIIAADGSAMTKSTDKELIISRNHIQPMKEFAYAPPTPVIPKPANNEIWYTATSKIYQFEETAFGANVVSNTYDAERECWVIKFDADIAMIGKDAFYGNNTDCNTLTSITIPDSVTTLGDNAFAYCKNLTSVTIPNSVTKIGSSTFYCCYSLENITIPEGVTTIGSWAFYYCKCITSATIPNSVTTIGDYAFSYCTSLTSLTMSNRVTSIAEGVFQMCNLLTGVTIPDSVTKIEVWAFSGCKSLTSVTIPARVTKIGDEAFSNCKSLKYVYCKPTVPPTLGGVTFGNQFSPTISTSAFDGNASDRRIIVPIGSGEAYKSAKYWSEYADAIYEEL